MKRVLMKRVFLLLLLSTVALAHAQVSETVPYTQGLKGDLVADIYRPAVSQQPLPAVIFIHGGGWTDGTRMQMQSVALALQKAGYFGMAIEYDLVPQGGTFPVSLHESWKAVEWLRAHAAQYGVDPKRVAVAGSSAGGELTALIGLGVDRPANVAPIAAAIVYNGVLDLTTFHDVKTTVNNYIGVPCTQKLQACQKASPIYNVRAPAPPFYVGHGTADETIPFAQATAFIAKLKSAGIVTQTFTAQGGPHTYWSKPQWHEDNLKATEKFLAQTLR